MFFEEPICSRKPCNRVSPCGQIRAEMLFETIRVHNGCAERLELHQARLERSGGRGLPPLSELILSAGVPPVGEFKVHISYSAAGLGAVRYEAYEPRVIRRMRAVETNILYPRKDEDRRAFELMRLMNPDVDELILCRNGWVTDTTYSNLLFGEPGEWYTPEHCLLPGTRRESLLRAREVRVLPIRCTEIMSFPYVSLINAMLEPGRLMLPTSQIELPAS